MAKSKDKYDPTTYLKPAAPAEAPAAYTPTTNTVGSYQPIKNTVGSYQPIKNTVSPYVAGTYKSQYQNQIDAGREQLTNWQYDPMKDASYQALAKVYGARGNLAAKNTLADAASLNGGYGTSYAVSAAQQARNTYNQELASLIPDLEQAAFNKAQVAYNTWRDADEIAYGRFRDTEGDRQWKYQQDYQAYRDRESDNQFSYNTRYNAYRDAVADSQWKYQQDYNAYRDRESDNQFKYQQNYQRYQDALSQYQWARNYDLDLYQMKQASSGGGGGGGGGRRRSGGGGGGYSSGSSGGSGFDAKGAWDAAQSAINGLFSGGGSKSGTFASGILKSSGNTASSTVSKLKKK